MEAALINKYERAEGERTRAVVQESLHPAARVLEVRFGLEPMVEAEGERREGEQTSPSHQKADGEKADGEKADGEKADGEKADGEIADDERGSRPASGEE